MRKFFIITFIIFFKNLPAQELYVFSEPASNMPARSISAKLSGHYVFDDPVSNGITQRYIAEAMLGISRKLMVHFTASFSDMHTNDFGFESYGTYIKYRFLSKDDIHKHFRMALFANASKTNAPFHYDEINLKGDKSGIEGGIIATQLWNKFAISTTVSHTQVFHSSRNDEIIYVPDRNYQAMNYSLSAGYLFLPKEYTDYKQTNLNGYIELLAQQTLDRRTWYADLAPAVQIIFNSNAKLNIGYRFQLDGTMQRMSRDSWLVSFERTFLNALKPRRK